MHRVGGAHVFVVTVLRSKTSLEAEFIFGLVDLWFVPVSSIDYLAILVDQASNCVRTT